MTNIEALCLAHNIALLKDEPLKNHCSFEIGGPATYFVEPSTTEQVSLITTLAHKEGIPFLVLGKGSNILFGDGGYQGIVLHLGDGLSQMELIDDTTIYCQAGAVLKDLCKFALKNSLTGMEPLYGIPGSVGGAIYMNAGAYGKETVDVIVAAHHINSDGNEGSYFGAEMDLSYRHSAYSDGTQIITGGTFRLEKGSPEEIKAQMDDFMGRRVSKQPLEYPSAGSTFKRPEGHYASALIDECGLKQKSVGGAQVSEKHAGFVINKGGATCQDVLELIAEVQEEVKKQTGVQLEPEVRLIGKQEG